MRRLFIVVLTSSLLGLGHEVKAQTAVDSVKATINAFFSAMKASDPKAMAATLADSAILQTITRNREGKMLIQSENLKAFMDVVGKMKPGAADEQIRFDVVKTDGPLAMAWTPYKFYYNEQFSHCGVNSFQVVRIDGEWKIQYIIDTRRRQGCE